MSLTNNSCLVQVQWEWTTSADAGRWGQQFQAFRPRQYYIPTSSASESYAYSVITTRNKVRGKGRAISIKFSTEAGKDCQLLGWNMEIRGNKEP